MVATYADVKTIVYISALGGGVALIAFCYLVHKKYNASQQEYLYFYCFVLLVLVIMVILLGLLISDMRNVYNANRAKLLAGATCVTDAGWSKLPTEMYNKSSMDSEHAWCCTFLAFSVIMALVALWSLYDISTSLDKLNRSNRY